MIQWGSMVSEVVARRLCGGEPLLVNAMGRLVPRYV
jgi:hypothetical protein